MDSVGGTRGGEGAAGRAYPGRLGFYHPNGKGTGAAVRLELRLNRQREDRYGCFFLEVARQRTVGRGSGPASRATFDWEHKATVKLGFLDICALLRVLEGEVERLGPEGKGLYHQNGATNTLITLQRSANRAGFYLGISRKESSSAEPMKAGILLSDIEALGLRCVFRDGLFPMVFLESRAREYPTSSVQQGVSNEDGQTIRPAGAVD